VEQGNKAASLFTEKEKVTRKFDRTCGEEILIMAILGDDEILARVHRFKLFRNEGNLYIDVYEAVLGKPPHKFIAVPNLLLKESEEKFFGVGDTKKDALTDCLKKIRAIPIQDIVPTDDLEGTEIEKKTTEYLKRTSRKTSSIWKLPKLFAKGPKENDE
jgi:hypothetical protein